MKNRRSQIKELLEGINTIQRNMVPRIFKGPKMLGITPSQMGVVILIGKHGPISIKDVAKILHTTSSAITQLVDGLVENGYVKRREGVEDRRVVELTLSKKAKDHFDKIEDYMADKFVEIFESLTDKEFDQYFKLQKKIFEVFSSKK